MTSVPRLFRASSIKACVANGPALSSASTCSMTAWPRCISPFPHWPDPPRDPLRSPGQSLHQHPRRDRDVRETGSYGKERPASQGRLPKPAGPSPHYAADLQGQAFETVSWWQGSKRLMKNRFAAARVRPANRNLPKNPDGVLPACWLLAAPRAMPKGLTTATGERAAEALRSAKQGVSAVDLSEATRISGVTARRCRE